MDTPVNHGIRLVNNIDLVKTIKSICLFNFRCYQINNRESKKVYSQVKS